MKHDREKRLASFVALAVVLQTAILCAAFSGSNHEAERAGMAEATITGGRKVGGASL